MTPNITVPLLLRTGEVLTLMLGFGLSTFAVCARLYTRALLTKTMMAEDYFSFFSWLAFLAYIALAIVIGKNGGGTISVAHLSAIESTIYCPIIVMVKISILLQYITLFVTHLRNFFHYSVHVLIWANILYYTIATLLYVFECSPRQKMWNPAIAGHCFSKHQIGVSSGTVNVISDFSILILPIPIICRLQVPWSKKSLVFAVFGVGLFACVASVVRLIYSIDLLHVHIGTTAYQLDTDRIGPWSFAEIAIGLIVGCLPALPRFFKHFNSKKFSLFSGSSGGQKSWLSFFRKSTTSNQGSSKRRPHWLKPFSNQGPFSAAPYISTLNLTRNSFELLERELPRRPSSICDRDKILAPTVARSHTLQGHATANTESALPSMNSMRTGYIGDLDSQQPYSTTPTLSKSRAYYKT